MSSKTVLILGGGWGGLTTAHHLRSLLSPEHRVVVVERNDRFSLHVSNLWLMTGERKDPEQVSRPMTNLKREGIEWAHAQAQQLDPESRTLVTDHGQMIGDYVVIALGAELAPDSVPGFEEATYNLYETEGAARLQEALKDFAGGKIVVLVGGASFRCPAAPYEAAMLTESLIRSREVQDDWEVSLYTPEAHPMAVAGPAVGEALEAMLAERGVGYFPEHAVTSVDVDSHTIHFGDTVVPYDLLIGVPPHRAPKLAIDSGLVDETGYIPVHPQTLKILKDPNTLETQFPNVYAIGDVTSVRLLNSMLLPKAGVFAEGQAQAVAGAIAADIAGQPLPHGFDGDGFCYVEVGDGMAAYGAGDFYAFPGPRVTLDMPNPQSRKAKEEYERLLDLWFEN